MSAERLVIIDFDGTIVASDGIWKKVYYDFCADSNIKSCEHLCNLQGRVSFNDWIREIKQHHKIAMDYTSLLKALNEIAINDYCQQKPNEGFVDYVKAHTNCELIIISKEETSLIKYYLAHYGIESIATIIQDTDESRTRSHYYLEMADRYNNLIDAVWLIDDSLSHCTAAKAGGAFVIGYNDFHSKERQEEMKCVCDKYINNFKEIIDL